MGFNFLGTTIQETFNWAPHTDIIANKISRTLGVMTKLKHFLPTYTLRTMYNSQILPHLNVSFLSWGLHTSRLSKLQKRAVRIITLNKYNAHTEPILKYLGLLKVNDIFTLQCLKCYFKCTHGRAPTFFCFVLHSKRCHSTLARFALARVSLARFTLASFIMTRFQFGEFLFGASRSPRFSLARFHVGAFLFGEFPMFVPSYDYPVSANAGFARTICAHVSFLRRRVVYLFLRA